MKRIIASILVLVAILFTTSCGSSDNSESLPKPETDEVEYSEFTWPKSDIAQLIPAPKSSIGKIEWETSYGFVIYVAETPKSDFDEYVSQCQDTGFMNDYSKGDDYFWGDNDDGYHLSLRLDEGDVMFVRMDEPDDTLDTEDEDDESGTSDTSITTDTDTETASDAKTDASMVTPEFKEMMDSYEDFFDEYIAFMKKYSESDDPLTMMDDFTNYMNKYTEVMEKMEEVNNTDLSIADSAYYLEVNNRIMKKLATI